MRHEQNAALAFIDGVFKVFDALGPEKDVVGFLEQIPIQKNMGKVMKLLPGAPEVKEPMAIGIQRLINLSTVANSAGEENKITCRHKPGKHQKNPSAPFWG